MKSDIFMTQAFPFLVSQAKNAVRQLPPVPLYKATQFPCPGCATNLEAREYKNPKTGKSCRTQVRTLTGNLFDYVMKVSESYGYDFIHESVLLCLRFRFSTISIKFV